ncbi:hypothetical protein YC2023_014310 [Brassica napus]
MKYVLHGFKPRLVGQMVRYFTTGLLALSMRYHVFPSFCGEDVCRNFLSHFHKELQLNGIDAFKDGGIKRSRSIWPELKQAIWESRVSIVVLSKN